MSGKYFPAFVITFAVLVGGAYYHDVRVEQHRSACQAKYNVAFVDAFNARAALGKLHADATDSLLGGVADIVLHPSAGDDKKFSGLFTNYVKSQAAYNQAKADNPYPTLSASCR